MRRLRVPWGGGQRALRGPPGAGFGQGWGRTVPLKRGSGSPHGRSHVLPVHTLWTPGCVRTPRCPQRGSCWTGAEAAPRGAWECEGCLLLFPSFCRPLWGWEQGVGTGVMGGDVDGPCGLCWEGPPPEANSSLSLRGAQVRLCWDGAVQRGLLGLALRLWGCRRAKGAQKWTFCAFPSHLGPSFLEGRVQSLIPNSFPWEH